MTILGIGADQAAELIERGEGQLSEAIRIYSKDKGESDQKNKGE
jgi:hypothetical protein